MIRCSVAFHLFQESDNADRHKLFHCQLGSGRLPGDPHLFAADRTVGCHGHVVYGHCSMQNRFVFAG